ncbi:hypothetical protein ACMFMG_004131 [Clarireedia jacksonii]
MEGHIPLELWMTLADERLPKSSLANLCLTSKTLNEIFRPVLYRDIVLAQAVDGKALQKKYVQLSEICQLPIESHLRHTRCLDVNYLGSIAKLWVKKCFEDMPNLAVCPLFTVPGSAGYFPLDKFTDVYLDWNGHQFLDVGQLYQWPLFPAFRNLRSLDLRRISGDLTDICSNVAGILFNDGTPTITALGLDIDNQTALASTEDLLLNITAEFDDLRRVAGVPHIRLKLRHLILGQGIFNSTFSKPLHERREDQLSRLADLSKLRTLRLLNYPQNAHELWQSWLSEINVKMLSQATSLEKLCVETCDVQVMQLLIHLSQTENSRNKITLRNFQARFIKDWIYFDSILPPGECYKWRQIIFGGLDLHNDISAHFSGQLQGTCGLPFDLEELGIGFLNWDTYQSYLLQFTNLHTLMCERVGHSRKLDIMEPAELARKIFKTFQKRMNALGRESKLRYVGIAGTVFTCLWLPRWAAGSGVNRTGKDTVNGSGSGAVNSTDSGEDFEIYELDKEEARAFDFVRMVEYTGLGKYRLSED